jgi:hypothetical protein
MLGVTHNYFTKRYAPARERSEESTSDRLIIGARAHIFLAAVVATRSLWFVTLAHKNLL